MTFITIIRLKPVCSVANPESYHHLSTDPDLRTTANPDPVRGKGTNQYAWKIIYFSVIYFFGSNLLIFIFQIN